VVAPRIESALVSLFLTSRNILEGPSVSCSFFSSDLAGYTRRGALWIGEKTEKVDTRRKKGRGEMTRPKSPLTGVEVAKHSSKDNCWVIVHGRAYDVTDFLPEHPGGMKIILKYAVRKTCLRWAVGRCR